jgi:hypothetical protein
MKRAAVAVSAVIASLVTGTAAAQPALTAPASPTYAMPAPMADAEPKSEASATLLAIGATALGYVALGGSGGDDNAALGFIGVAGALVGPSAGHIYAGENGHALKMSLLRTGAIAAVVAGMIRVMSSAVDDSDCLSDCSGDRAWHDYQRNGEVMIYAGGITFVAATIYDIVDASRAARRYNDKHKARPWQVAPSLARDAGGGVSPAFVVSGRW